MFNNLIIWSYGLCLFIFPFGDKSYSVSSNIDRDITLQYQQFLRDEAKEHRLFIENSFEKLLWIISTCGVILVSVLGWVNYKTKDEIKQSVDKRMSRLLTKRIEEIIEKTQEESKSKFIEIQNKSEMVDKILMELSAMAEQIRSEENLNSTIEKYNNAINQHKILWVDDNPDNNIYIIDMLARNNIHIELAMTTTEAVNMLSSNKYDMIISDMDRSGIIDDGMTLLDIRNKKYKNIPLIFFTSSQSISMFGEVAMNRGATFITDKTSKLIGYIQNYIKV